VTTRYIALASPVFFPVTLEKSGLPIAIVRVRLENEYHMESI